MKQGSAFDCSLRVLALRDHSEAELRRKLKEKGYEPEGIEQSVARLRELRYLDDARFARQFASASVRNGRGVGARLKLELTRRGIAPALVSEVLSELAQEFSEKELIDELLERRFAGFDPEGATEKERRRIIGYLQRKGFSLSAIFTALRESRDPEE